MLSLASRSPLLVTLSILTAPAISPAANILTNAGFETGDLSGWRGLGSPAPVFTVASNGSAAHSGVWFADTQPLPAPFTQSVIQDFAPVDTGTIVEMSFWYRQPNTAVASPAVYAYFEEGPAHSAVYASVTVIADGQWHKVTFGSPGVNATYSSFGALAQNISGAPGTTGLQFDDFFFSNTPVPEPASASLACSGAVLLLRRRRRGSSR